MIPETTEEWLTSLKTLQDHHLIPWIIFSMSEEQASDPEQSEILLLSGLVQGEHSGDMIVLGAGLRKMSEL